MTKHIMDLARTYSSNAERWTCANCDKQIILQWYPFKRIVLSEGDTEIQHSGSKGGLQINNVEILESMSNDLRGQLEELLENL